MSKDLIDAKTKADQLEMAVTRLKMQLQQQVAETEERQCQATSYYNSVEAISTVWHSLRIVSVRFTL